MSMMDLGASAPSQPFSEAPEGDSGASIVKQIISLVRQYAEQEEDEQNVLSAEKITTMLQQILANEQKEKDGMLQGKMSPAAMRKAYGG